MVLLMTQLVTRVKTKVPWIVVGTLVLKVGNCSKDNLDYWLGAEDLDNDGVWHWTTSGHPLLYTNWWTHPGRLNSTCAQLLRKGATQPGLLDSFYWTMAHTAYDCQDTKDGDNGIICEKNPDVTLP